jgi:capsid portal protein
MKKETLIDAINSFAAAHSTASKTLVELAARNLQTLLAELPDDFGRPDRTGVEALPPAASTEPLPPAPKKRGRKPKQKEAS